MNQYHKYVGLDVHKERNEVAIAEASGEVRLYGSISNDLHALEKLVYKLRAQNVVLHFVYEAGPPSKPTPEIATSRPGQICTLDATNDSDACCS